MLLPAPLVLPRRGAAAALRPIGRSPGRSPHSAPASLVRIQPFALTLTLTLIQPFALLAMHPPHAPPRYQRWPGLHLLDYMVIRPYMGIIHGHMAIYGYTTWYHHLHLLTLTPNPLGQCQRPPQGLGLESGSGASVVESGSGASVVRRCCCVLSGTSLHSSSGWGAGCGRAGGGVLTTAAAFRAT